MKKEYRCVEKTRKVIKSAFVELLGEKKKMDTITVTELIQRANIAKSTFYNHYDDVYSVAEEFEDELISKMLSVFMEFEHNRSAEYDEYIRQMILFLKNNEEIYRKAILSSDIRFFLEKLKSIISKKIFEESKKLPFSHHPPLKYAQIRLLTNACVDTMCDYFKGNINLTLDEVGNLLISFLNALSNGKF